MESPWKALRKCSGILSSELRKYSQEFICNTLPTERDFAWVLLHMSKEFVYSTESLGSEKRI
jgi:hypothetical protein